MKAALIGFAGLALAALMPVAPAQAQELPQGSYLQTCRDARIERGRLVAVCRRTDGRGNPTALSEPYRCNGGISNINGVLRCEAAGGPPPPGYGPPEREGGYGPPEGTRYGEFRERCERWRHEAGELRDRISSEYDPYERGRLEGRLHELRDRLERCRY